MQSEPVERRPPEPISALSVAGLIILVLGLVAWPLTGYWQAAVLGLAACLITMLIDAARIQRRRMAAHEARRVAWLDK